MLTRLSRFGSVFPRFVLNSSPRFLSHSKASGSSAAVTELQSAGPTTTPEEFSPFVKNPDYHGFSDDPMVDVWNMRIAFFFGISMALVIGGTFIHYLPDPGMRQWARREAERLILQREKEGLPLIDENYYDPNTIILPPAGEE